MKEIDYDRLYAERLREDHSLFKQQKMLIESQMKASQSLFAKAFPTKKDKRGYLRKVGLI